MTTMSKAVPWSITVEAVVLYETDPLLWDSAVLMNQVNESVSMGYGTVESNRLVVEGTEDDTIDHAQTTLRAFVDASPDIPGSTAYTAPTDRQRNRRGQYVTDDGVRDQLGRFTNEAQQGFNGGRPPDTTGHCSRCGQPGRNRLTCLARFSRKRSEMRHRAGRSPAHGRVFKTPNHVRQAYPDRRFTDCHHRVW